MFLGRSSRFCPLGLAKVKSEKVLSSFASASSIIIHFGRSFRVPEVFESYRFLQTFLFLTDSVFCVLFAYFDESMASKIVYNS